MIWILPLALAGRVEVAEAHRLSGEITDLEARGVWNGVDRAYRRIETLGVPLDVNVHLAGARAALQHGNADVARHRLLAAYEVERRPEVLDWLTSFSRDFARLDVKVDPGATLEVERLPFDPDRARVIERAMEKIARTHEFDGLLPVGRYRIGSFWFRITVDGPDVAKDLRQCVTTEVGCSVDAVDPLVQTFVP